MLHAQPANPAVVPLVAVHICMKPKSTLDQSLIVHEIFREILERQTF